MDRLITICFEDETIDLSGFPVGTPVHITSEDGTIIATGGVVFTDPFRVLQKPAELVDHTHGVTGTTGSPT